MCEDFPDSLRPVSLDTFFADYWGRRSLHVAGDPGRFSTLLDSATLAELQPRCGSIKAGFLDERGWYCDVAIQPEQVKRLWEAGMTICTGVLPTEGPRARFINSCRSVMGLAGHVYFNAYRSPPGKGFALHVDDHPVVVLHLEGEKRWWLSRDIGVPDPPRGFNFPPGLKRLTTPWGVYERPDEGTFQEITLRPGDLLYVPAGMWHRTQAVTASLSLTMAMVATAPMDLVRPRLETALVQQPALRRRLAGLDRRTLNPDAIPEALAGDLEDAAAAIRALANRMDAATLYRLWLEAATSEPADDAMRQSKGGAGA
ncbi:JmjC domain-containing protein [Azospirillum sp. B510]|uniref:JmjC domain-containing protein n=1 Tax=Azospirillum sp. (strain B510) TaxID=137722 RepID=UPI0011D04BEB|nr:cupin domain-containing protein [Azospirillum sp. B510]